MLIGAVVLLDPNENDGTVSEPRDNGDGHLDLGLAALVAVHGYEANRTGFGNERVNLNEADKTTLKSVLNLSETLASAVMK